MRRLPLDLAAYRAALYLYPPAFRREFADEMREHAAAARAEAARGGPGAVARFALELAGDLALTLVVQWLRSGWPVIVVGATLVPLTLAAFVLGLASRVPFTLPSGTPDAEATAITLLASVCVVLIATTIILTVWFSPRPVHRRR